MKVLVDKHRFDENYADDIHEYRRYIDKVVVER